MTSILKRLSISRSLARDDAPGSARLPASTSFNDFSLHVGQEHADDHHPDGDLHGPRVNAAPCAAPPEPFLVGSAPAASHGFASFAKTTTALRIPRTSVAHLLEQRLRANAEAGTPRSSLDVPPSPRAPPPPLSSPRSPMSLAGSGLVDEPPSPRSPRSPTTPGGRRRKSQKIDGMDYYEFCELIRSSSL